MSASDVDALLPSFEELTYPAEGVIFRKGEFDPALYVLLEGSVEISLEVPGSRDAVIVRLEPKGVFGESSFFHPAPHGATVRCVSPSVALRLSHGEYQRNWASAPEFMQAVYARPDYIQTLDASTPIAAHVPVDFELRGCPINKRQLLEVIASLLGGRRPRTPVNSVCLDCKRRGTVCVMVARGDPCLGPVTHAGCEAICPSYDRGCYGCYGPAEQPNLASLTNQFRAEGLSRGETVRSASLIFFRMCPFPSMPRRLMRFRFNPI